MILCLDTETTGLHPENGDEIIQLSIVQIDGNFEFDEYFAPTNVTSFPEASRVTGLYYDEPVPNGSGVLLRDCPPISDPDVHADIQGIFDSADLIVGYNLNFDVNMLEHAGFQLDHIPMSDPMFDFRDYYIDEGTEGFEEHRLELWRDWIDDGRGGFKTKKLIEAADYFGYDPGFADNAHNSLFDVYATIFVWEQLEAIGWGRSITRAELAAMSARR